jgi:hypothetical protein
MGIPPAAGNLVDLPRNCKALVSVRQRNSAAGIEHIEREVHATARKTIL